MIRITMLVIALGACGKGDKAGQADKGPPSGATNADGEDLPRNGACDTRAKNQMCVDYFGQPGTEPGLKESIKKSCAAAEGTTLEKCPTEGAFGRCISNEIRIQQLLVYAPMTKEKAELYCKGMGDGKLGPP